NARKARIRKGVASDIIGNEGSGNVFLSQDSSGADSDATADAEVSIVSSTGHRPILRPVFSSAVRHHSITPHNNLLPPQPSPISYSQLKVESGVGIGVADEREGPRKRNQSFGSVRFLPQAESTWPPPHSCQLTKRQSLLSLEEQPVSGDKNEDDVMAPVAIAEDGNVNEESETEDKGNCEIQIRVDKENSQYDSVDLTTSHLKESEVNFKAISAFAYFDPNNLFLTTQGNQKGSKNLN
ncbi:unnamed protein product, partial [Hydatigera taeniaeformis]|uniref:Kinesin motor domain-containing protein n=1 Tax=Hydatigena taeniaeformis TaxID=6205 RepID=A0A0R3WUK2_HYDTA